MMKLTDPVKKSPKDATLVLVARLLAIVEENLMKRTYWELA